MRAYAKDVPDCRLCHQSGNEALRREWGCDGLARRDLYEIGCSRCDGTDGGCSACKGRGSVGMRKCPGRLLERRPDVARALDAYMQLDARSVLPAEGGWLDQSAAFVDACAIIEQERNRVRDAEERGRDRSNDAVLSKAAERTAKYRGR